MTYGKTTRTIEVFLFMLVDFKTAADIATILAAFFAGGSVFYLARQVKFGIEESRNQRTYDFTKRFNDPVFGRMLAEAVFFLARLENDEKLLKDFVADPKKNTEWSVAYQTVNICLNFFEEIGEFYSRGFLNESMVDNFFSGSSLYYYARAEKYINLRIKKVGRPKLFKVWREMNETFKSKGLK